MSSLFLECAGCGKKYDLSDLTFNPRTLTCAECYRGMIAAKECFGVLYSKNSPICQQVCPHHLECKGAMDEKETAVTRAGTDSS